MMLADAIRHFLQDIIVSDNNLDVLPEPIKGLNFNWVVYLRNHLHLICMPINIENNRYPVGGFFFAKHPVHGPVLMKEHPTVFNNKHRMLSLDSGEEHWSQGDEDLTGCHIIVEPLDIEGPVTEDVIKSYVLKPVQRLSRLMMCLQMMLTMTGSVLFITNFTVLAYVVPSQNLHALYAIGWLIFAAVITLISLILLISRIRTKVDSLLDERTEILKLSLLVSIRPDYLISEGPRHVDEMCGVVADLGRAALDAKMAIIMALMIAPILFFMYLRLPSILFFVTVIVVIGGSVFQFYFQSRHRKSSQTHASEQTKIDLYFDRILDNLQRLKFYGSIPTFLSNWEKRQAKADQSQKGLVASEAIASESTVVLQDITLIIAIVGLSIVIALNEGNTPLTVSAAFIMLFTVQQFNIIIPRALDATSQYLRVNSNFEKCKGFLNDVSLHGGSDTMAVGLKTTVEFKYFNLPHHCRFIDHHEGLTAQIAGKKVVMLSGESGVGKSTFLRCLLGLNQPASGSLEVLNVNPVSLSSTHRQSIFSYASQDVQLLPGTIRDNLLLLNTSVVTDQVLWEALEKVSLAEIVRALPLGMGTPITEALLNFSTGERQRMILAQCLTKKSQILVLDEAMSGLSEEMETQIFTNIKPYFDQIYFVSHRVHMREYADLIIELGKTENEA